MAVIEAGDGSGLRAGLQVNLEYLGAGGAVEQHVLDYQTALRHVAVDQALQHRITRCRWIGAAEIDLAAGERHVVIAAGRAAHRIVERQTHAVGLGIDQPQAGVAILVDQRPDLAGGRG